MQEKRNIVLLGSAVFLLLTLFFVFWMRPQTESITTPMPQVVESNAKENAVVKESTGIKPQARLQAVAPKKPETSSAEEIKKGLSQDLKALKEGKRSALNLVFSDADLNKSITELLALAEGDEAWANYALGQVVDACAELHQRSETEIIEMFSMLSNSPGMDPEQMSAMNDLQPIVVNAAERCRSIDKGLLAGLGGDARSWFRTGAEKGDANSYVTSGYTLIDEELKANSKEYQAATDENRWKIAKELRTEARSEFRKNMRDKIANGAMTPELLVNISEHLNLFYDEDSPLKRREAWLLAACDMGYENNCSADSTAVKLMCMFQQSCQTGTDFKQGIVWKQGQFKFDEYQQSANEIKRIIENKEWDKLGF